MHGLREGLVVHWVQHDGTCVEASICRIAHRASGRIDLTVVDAADNALGLRLDLVDVYYSHAKALTTWHWPSLDAV